MRTVLVAGATGSLGSYVVEQLTSKGYRVRALVREPHKLAQLGLEVDEVHQGDLTRPSTLVGCCKGVDAVISCAGSSLQLGNLRDRRSFQAVDMAGNGNLLYRADQSGVTKFIYVSLYGGSLLAHSEYAGAHERFVAALVASGIPYCVVRPTGFFSFFAQILDQARKGRGVVIGSGETYTNPVHEVDVAECCVNAMEEDSREIAIGGHEVNSRQEIVELAFEVVGRSPRLRRLSPRLVQGLMLALRPLNPRLSALLEFGLALSSVDLVAPARGKWSLRAYFEELCAMRSDW